MDKKTILIIDDDKKFCTLMKEHFEATGDFEVSDCFTEEKFATKGFSDTESLFRLLSEKRPDLILLDLMMPGLSGFEICKSLKEKESFSSIPIIILSGKSDDFDKVSCLNMGADDYVVKPCSLHELNARARAVLRRQVMKGEEKKINVGDMMVIDLQRYQVTVDGKKVELTTAEFMILKFLSSRKGRVFSRARILDYLWGSPKGVTERTIDVHIRHLREKLGKAGRFIKNVRGIGYKLEEDI